MPQTLRISILSSVLLAAWPLPPAQAAPLRVTSAYAYSAQERFRGITDGTLWVAFRTNRRVPEDRHGNPRVPGAPGTPYVISRRERCYGTYVQYYDGRGRQPMPGDRLPLRLGPGGRWLDTTLIVRRPRPGYGQGGAIGCTRDRRARIHITNLTRLPLVAPDTLFFAANNGPRMVDIRWFGWGERRAVGRGAWMARSPGTEGSDEELDVRPAKLRASRPRMCMPYGALTYTRFVLITRDGRYRKRVERWGQDC